MKYNVRYLFGLLMALSFTNSMAQPTVRFDATKTHQHITGFGGFVCSPQFGYNHMSTTEIKKVWGPESTVGCNIMRLYIPIGKSSWSQSLSTAKTAKQMGLIVFASPWGQPAEWKANNSSNAKNSDGKEGRLKRENWADYAQYLEDYVQYLRQNGQWGFRRLDAPTTLGVFDVYAALNSQAAFVPIASDALSISTITSESETLVKVFDLQGRQISAQPQKPGIYIKSGKKIVVK